MANQKQLIFNYYIASDVPRQLLGDEMRLRQVVTNLISNSVKFTNHGSVELRVRAIKPGESAHEALHHPTSQRPSVEERVHASGVGHGHADKEGAGASADARESAVPAGSVAGLPAAGSATFLFEVLDTGIGINKEDQGRLFNAFQQVITERTRQQGGTGLGLAISMRLVRLMGGDMVVNSNGAGQGSRFAFTVNLRLKQIVETTLPPLRAGPLVGRQVYIVSTCASFIRTASSLAASVGLEPVVLNVDQTRGLLAGPPGWGSAVALIIDREFIPRDAVKDFEEISAVAKSGGEGGSGSAQTTAGTGGGMLNSKHGVIIGSDRYFDSCSEFINSINSSVMTYWQSHTSPQDPPPAVMVLTFSSPCMLSERVSVTVKPLIHRNFVRWIEKLAAERSTGANLDTDVEAAKALNFPPLAGIGSPTVHAVAAGGCITPVGTPQATKYGGTTPTVRWETLPVVPQCEADRVGSHTRTCSAASSY